MAEAAVSFVLHKLADVALNKALQLYHVSDKVKPIQVKLDLIQGFLQDADSKQKKNEAVKRWVKQLREVAHKIEDAMDTFLVEIEEQNPSTNSGFFTKMKRVLKNPIKLDWFADEIQKIEKTLDAIRDEATTLGITRSLTEQTGSGENSAGPFRPTKLHEIDVSEVVGLEGDKDKIIKRLVDTNISKRTVLSIIGTGGLGKTTLAKKVYESIEIKRHFYYCTWLSISQKFNVNNLLREILYSILPQMKNKQPIVRDEDLPEELVRSLSKKRYLITLDDVWTAELWEQLKVILPNTNNGSRVLITSRFLDVATFADPKTPPYPLRFLTPQESLVLLLKKALGNNQPVNCPLPNNQPVNCPRELKDVAERLTQKCDGLPLALIVLGGILSKRLSTYSAWHKVEQTMNWYTEGTNCSQVLAMSYEDLPYHLKPCFLYFASFPEDHKISAKHVTRMWIAEGFIAKDGPGTLEDKAEMYLEDLVRRCLVQVIEQSWDECCKYCGVHDLLRDLAIHEAKEVNFFTVLPKDDDDASSARRATLQFSTPIECDILSTKTRSLLFFRECISNYSGFKLLRVLTIEHVDMSSKEVEYGKWLKGLIHLRYLGFRYCEGLSSGFWHFSFGSLKNLETLDFKDTTIEEKPTDFQWNIPTLRHVIFQCIDGPSKWDYLKNVQTLKWVRLQNFPKLGCNLKMRTLGLLLGSKFWEQCRSIEQAQDMLKGLLARMELLVSLSIHSEGTTNLPRNTGHLSFPFDGTTKLPRDLTKLYLEGQGLEGIVLNVQMFPKLTKLTLKRTWLSQDPMPILGRLESLKILRLWLYSYDGTELICTTGGFPSLQILELEDLLNLCQWDISEGAMPMLSRLVISHCSKLDSLPELQHVKTLQDLIIREPSEKLLKNIQSEDQYKINHIPSKDIGSV